MFQSSNVIHIIQNIILVDYEWNNGSVGIAQTSGLVTFNRRKVEDLISTFLPYSLLIGNHIIINEIGFMQ